MTYQVDIENDLQVSGQEVLHHGDRPLLHCLWKDCVVGKGKSLGHNIPGIIPAQLLLIDQEALELNNSQRRMGVIELDCNLIRKIGPLAHRLLEATKNVMKGCSSPEVLLLQSKFLSSHGVIIRVQDTGDLLGVRSILNGLFVIALIETGQVEDLCGLAAP